MRKKRNIYLFYTQLIFIVLFTAIFVKAQTPNNEWNGIVLLKSTKTDVDKLLGAPKIEEINLYETEKEKVVVWYSQGNCKENQSSVWNVPKTTVIGILVSPKTFLNVTTLIGEMSQTFEKHRDTGRMDLFTYFNQDSSLKFQTRILSNGTEDVVFVAYAPAALNNNLLCTNQKQKLNYKHDN